MQQYRSGLTVLTPKIVPYEDGKEFPAITFCNETGFKAVEDYSDLDTYLNDTMDFQDMFLSPIKLAMGFGNKTVLDYENFLEILTAYRGRCYTYKSAYKVIMPSMKS